MATEGPWGGGCRAGRGAVGHGAGRGSVRGRDGPRTAGSGDPAGAFSLPELLLVVAVVSLLAGLGAPGVAGLAEGASLDRSAALARAHLGRARVLAVSRRETLRVRVGAAAELLLLDGRDSLLAAADLSGPGFLGLDSVRLRPRTLRFNARGQAAPGSLYLYRGRRAVRLVSNFVGRVRREDLRL